MHYPTVDCNTLQHAATHCNALQRTANTVAHGMVVPTVHCLWRYFEICSRTLHTHTCMRACVVTYTCCAWGTCDLTHSYVQHDSFLLRHTFRIHAFDMAHSDMVYDSFICSTERIFMCGAPTYVWHTFICGIWLIQTCEMIHTCLYKWHRSVIYGPVVVVVLLQSMIDAG